MLVLTKKWWRDLAGVCFVATMLAGCSSPESRFARNCESQNEQLNMIPVEHAPEFCRCFAAAAKRCLSTEDFEFMADNYFGGEEGLDRVYSRLSSDELRGVGMEGMACLSF